MYYFVLDLFIYLSHSLVYEVPKGRNGTLLTDKPSACHLVCVHSNEGYRLCKEKHHQCVTYIPHICSIDLKFKSFRPIQIEYLKQMLRVKI